MMPAPEQNPGSLGQYAQVLTQRLLDERQHGGLARARSAGEDDPPCFVAPSASAIDHRHSSRIWLSSSGCIGHVYVAALREADAVAAGCAGCSAVVT